MLCIVLWTGNRATTENLRANAMQLNGCNDRYRPRLSFFSAALFRGPGQNASKAAFAGAFSWPGQPGRLAGRSPAGQSHVVA